MKIFGVLGILLVQGSTLFQIFHFLQRKRTAGVSIGFWWTVYVGLVCYLFYAISIVDWVYITSNTIGIILSSISIVMYYYYERREKNGHVRMGSSSGSGSASVGGYERLPARDVSSAGQRAILPKKPVVRRNTGAGHSNRGDCANTWEMQEKEMLTRGRSDKYYVNHCPDCYAIWTNFQGTNYRLNLEMSERMIQAGAKRRVAHCAHCRKEGYNARQNRQSTKKP